MKRLLTLASGAALAGSCLLSPAMATTDTGAYTQHETSCLGLLFTDLKAHEAECGPFNQPAFTFPTGGSGAGGATCQTGEVQIFGPSRPILVADANPCGGSLCPNSGLQYSFPNSGLLPFVERSGSTTKGGRTVLIAGC